MESVSLFRWTKWLNITGSFMQFYSNMSLTKIANSFQLEIQLEWIGLSWYWVGVSWFILEYWISNWNKILDQLSPIGNSVGLRWFDLSELELVGFCIFPIGNFISQQMSNWNQLCLVGKKSNRVHLGLKWVGKKVQLNPTEFNCVKLCPIGFMPIPKLGKITIELELNWKFW